MIHKALVSKCGAQNILLKVFVTIVSDCDHAHDIAIKCQFLGKKNS